MAKTIYTLDRKVIQDRMILMQINGRTLDKRCGFSSGMTSRILNQKAQKFTIDTLMRLSSILEINPIYLIKAEPLMKYIRYDKRKPKTFKK